MLLDVKSLPELTQRANNACQTNLEWAKLSQDDLMNYCMKTEVVLSNIHLPKHAIQCTDVNCNDISHCNDLCTMYECIVDAVHKSSHPYLTCVTCM